MDTESGEPFEQPEPQGPELNLESNEWVLPNDTSVIMQIIQEVEKRLRAAGWGETQASWLPIGVEEATRNAMVHGNLDVSRTPEDTQEAFKAKILAAAAAEQAALVQHQQAAKHVYLSLAITPEQATFCIRDEGKGFNPETVPDPTADENLFRGGGRGILLMKKIFDEVKFDGSTVTLTARRKEQGAA